MEANSWIDPMISYDKVVDKRKISRVHYHAVYELYYLTSGNTKYFIGDEIFHLNQGDFIFVPKGILHSTDSEECLHNERILLSFDDNMVADEVKPLLACLTVQKHIRVSFRQQTFLDALLVHIRNEYEAMEEDYLLTMKFGISEILLMLARHGKHPAPRQTDIDRTIQAVSEYISENDTADLSLQALSKRFAISESHLSRRFKAFSGIGLNAYIKYVRIHHAAKLLEETALSVTEVAAQCGFNDSNYFSSVFKAAKGITPYRYAKRFRS